MATNLKIDENLLNEAFHIGGFRTKKDTVNEALKAYIQHQKQLKTLDFEGAFEEFDEFDQRVLRKKG